MFLLNKLKDVDVVFFVVIAAIIAVIVLVYFLIPVINHKKYSEMRERLFEREKSLRGAFSTTSTEKVETDVETSTDVKNETVSEE